MKLHKASLFPGVDGYALSLKLRYDSMKATGRTLEENLRKCEDEGYQFIPWCTSRGVRHVWRNFEPIHRFWIWIVHWIY